MKRQKDGKSRAGPERIVGEMGGGVSHRIEKMPTRDRLCEQCCPTLKTLSRET